MLQFLTHDNGASPFRVIADPNSKRFQVYHNQDFPENPPTQLLIDSTFRQIWIGKSPFNAMTKFSGGYGPEFDGNSILVELDPKRYLFIGHKIFSFKTRYPIQVYVSPVGNNDVPYPFAIDSHGQYYLMIENVILPPFPSTYRDEPYDFYYENSHLAPRVTRRILPTSTNPYVDVGIRKFYIDGPDGWEQYNLSFESEPAKDYVRLTENGTYKMMVVDDQGNQKILTKQAYIHLMKTFSKKTGIRPLKVDVWIPRRYDSNFLQRLAELKDRPLGKKLPKKMKI